mmetsp:Transcript_28705/g.28373  ORF Transcript_28705/g.28373 Transcript_28705/m.28373 type:complete len:100 (-) Transcript_28705:1658-1957(-)
MIKTPPENVSNATMSALTASISKWLVGSSKNKMCGCLKATAAKATLDFCPPDKKQMGLNARFPVIPNDPKWALITSEGVLGYCLASCSNGDDDKSSWSM